MDQKYWLSLGERGYLHAKLLICFRMLWQFLPKKYELNGWIRHSDWHWLSEAVPSIMVQSCWWGSQIIDQKKSGCCRWLTFVQDEWFTGHTSYLHAKWSICFRMLWQAFPLKMWLVWVEVSPRFMRTRFQDSLQV